MLRKVLTKSSGKRRCAQVLLTDDSSTTDSMGGEVRRFNYVIATGLRAGQYVSRAPFCMEGDVKKLNCMVYCCNDFLITGQYIPMIV